MDELVENLNPPSFCLYNIGKMKLLKMKTISKGPKRKEYFLLL